jgi:hypothetical protein
MKEAHVFTGMDHKAVRALVRRLEKENAQLALRVVELEKAFNQYGGRPHTNVPQRASVGERARAGKGKP